MSFAPRFTITNAVTTGLTAIERARGFLEAAKLSDEWMRRMSERALLLEAHHTTHIEGTQLTIEQAERVWAGERVAEARPDDVRELLNYRSAFNLVSESLVTGEPITEGLVREIHRRLVEGVRGGSGSPGAYRTIQNCVASSTTGAIIYTPPPPIEVPALMQELDLTGWLEFFIEGLATQLAEVKARGEVAIRSDVIAKQHRLNERQAALLEQLMSRGTATLADLESRFPEVTRRTLQRDLKLLATSGLLRESGTARTDPNRHYIAVTSYDRKV